MKTLVLPWVVSALVIALFAFAVGYRIRGKFLGIFVDARNRMSLSQFQIVLWTIVIVSAFCAIALGEKTLDIYIPPEIWALMAISTGSAAGAIIIKGTKSEQEPTPQAQAQVAARAQIAGGPMANPASEPRLGVLALADRPRLSDMFKGEEITDKDYVDISKVQMFFFTIAAIFGYVLVLLSDDLAGGGGTVEEGFKAYFPTLSTSLVTMIGISHVGYLTMKAAPHTPTQ